MKKILICLLVLLNILTLFGCAGIDGQINTRDNRTFFPTEKSDLHRDELEEAYKKHPYHTNQDITGRWGEYEVFNHISRRYSRRYDLDIFEVCYSEKSVYLVKHKDKIYDIAPFALSNGSLHFISHIAVTDINNDGYIEILTSVCSTRFDRNYGWSYITIIDTKTESSVNMFDHYNIDYFKENEEGVISIYNTNGVLPDSKELSKDISNGKLDESYYDLSNNLYEVPKLNTIKYTFKEHSFKTSCDLYEVEIIIDDDTITFPYITQTPRSFTINVKMTYLGEPFTYVNDSGYLDGATILFVNSNNQIEGRSGLHTQVVTKFNITYGMVIENKYIYYDHIDEPNEPGIYDMVINYQNIIAGINESITIEDFLEVSWES